MSHSIIEAALTNKTLRLELTYRAPLMLLEEDDDTAELEIRARLEPPNSRQPIPDEFACLLSAI